MDNKRVVSSMGDAIELLGQELVALVKAESTADKKVESARGAVLKYFRDLGVLSEHMISPKGDKGKEVVTLKNGESCTRLQLFESAKYMARNRLTVSERELLDKPTAELSDSRKAKKKALQQSIGSQVGNKWRKGLATMEERDALNEAQDREDKAAAKEGREAKDLTLRDIRVKSPAIDRVRDRIRGIVTICTGTEELPKGVNRGECAQAARALYSMFGINDPDAE